MIIEKLSGNGGLFFAKTKDQRQKIKDGKIFCREGGKTGRRIYNLTTLYEYVIAGSDDDLTEMEKKIAVKGEDVEKNYSSRLTVFTAIMRK